MSNRNALSIIDGALVVVPRGMDRVWGFRRRIVVPLARIVNVEVEHRPHRVPTGWRGPGLDVFVKKSGTFHPRGKRHYWNISGTDAALRVDIANGTPFDRLYLSVAEPEAACRMVSEAVARAR